MQCRLEVLSRPRFCARGVSVECPNHLGRSGGLYVHPFNRMVGVQGFLYSRTGAFPRRPRFGQRFHQDRVDCIARSDDGVGCHSTRRVVNMVEEPGVPCNPTWSTFVSEGTGIHFPRRLRAGRPCGIVGDSVCVNHIGARSCKWNSTSEQCGPNCNQKNSNQRHPSRGPTRKLGTVGRSGPV